MDNYTLDHNVKLPENAIPKYQPLGESGLVEDEKGNIFSPTELEEVSSEPRSAKDQKRLDSFIKTTFVSSLDDKANPAYWHYIYDPRYCGPDPDAYAEEMAQRYRNREVHADTEEKADREQQEAEQQGLHPVFRIYKGGKVFCGIANRKKEIVIPSTHYSIAFTFRNGRALAQNRLTKKYGFLDPKGNEVIPCTWRSAEVFTEHKAGVVGDNGKCGYIDVTGKLIIPCTWDNGWPFHGGLARVQQNGKIGMIDKKGTLVIPCQWAAMGDMSERLIGVKDNWGYCGYVDMTGQIVIPCQWKQVWMFKEGMAPVQDESGRIGFINKRGTLVIPCIWKKVNFFHNGRAKVTKSRNLLLRNKWVYINKKGEIVASPTQK